MMADCNWIFLSKHGQDEYINMLARSAGAEPYNSDHFDYYYDVVVDDRPVVLRGILKHKIMQECWRDGKTFYYMDSGYFGNNKSARNPRGDKLWHRIVKNDLQHGDIVIRPDDRLRRLGIVTRPRRTGRQIIVAAPDEKPCKFYGIDQQQWVADTVAEIKRHTDRPVVIRQRAAKREDRVHRDPLEKLLLQDTHALVTFNSVAATEAVVLGVPAFALAPANAALPVANRDLSQIETPYWPDDDKRHAWLCHLSYGQWHVQELRDGTAYRMLNES